MPVTVTGVRSASPAQPGTARGIFIGHSRHRDGQRCHRPVWPLDRPGTKCRDDAAHRRAGEVHTGDAELWTTLSGRTAQHYTVRIERVGSGGQDANRDLTLRITDPALLSVTGGIVQG